MYVIQHKDDSEAFWSTTYDTWVARDEATELPAEAMGQFLLPKHGKLVDRRHGLTFKIVRKFKDPNKADEQIEEGLSFDEAREHCSDPSTSGDGWFDAFYEE
jgi:hypothetical protein